MHRTWTNQNLLAFSGSTRLIGNVTRSCCIHLIERLAWYCNDLWCESLDPRPNKATRDRRWATNSIVATDINPRLFLTQRRHATIYMAEGRNRVLKMGTAVACRIALGCMDCDKPDVVKTKIRMQNGEWLVTEAKSCLLLEYNNTWIVQEYKKEDCLMLSLVLKIKCQGTWPALVSREIVVSTSFSDPSNLSSPYAFPKYQSLALNDHTHLIIDPLPVDMAGSLVAKLERTRMA